MYYVNPVNKYITYSDYKEIQSSHLEKESAYPTQTATMVSHVVVMASVPSLRCIYGRCRATS